MCGISGIIRFDHSSSDVLSNIRKMNDAIRHRGPDGEGFLCIHENSVTPVYASETPEEIRAASFRHSPKKNIAEVNEAPIAVLGHRRLSIIDLSAGGHQPLCSADGKVWITYNGEIYNYPELRVELEKEGFQFRTHTDSEVVIAAYRKWGTECLQRFNGMWAFVIWDSEKKKFFGSRDRTGVKPFYYFRTKSVFVFASEQKAFLENDLVKTSLNPVAVADYFVAGEIESREEGFYKNIFELFPGHAFEIELQGKHFRKWKWYTPEFKERQIDFTDHQYKEFADEIREKLVNAVRLRLRSDVPVGSCLSGGIDSSAIVGIIHHIIGQKEKVNIGDHLKLFTSVFDEKEIDERNWAEKVVKRTNGEWHTVNPKPEELLTDLEDLVRCQDVPIWSTSTYAQFRTMKLVKENNIKVVLDGQGGDELFAGYFPYFIPFWRELKDRNKRLLVRDEMKAFGEHSKAYKKREFLKQRFVPSLPVRQQLIIQKNYFPDIKYLDSSLLSLYCDQYKKKELPEDLNATLRNEFFGTRLKGYLKCEDRCSMWHSVESRTPFSEDHHLFETVFRIPGAMKIRHGLSKYLLREAVKPFVPADIYSRRDKMGYVTPNNKWIESMKGDFRQYFDVDLNGIIKKEKLFTDYNTFFSVKDQPENGRVFKFVAFAAWRKVTGL
ncbi:MAG TPA: asparagine synthase (glutamine-hydrolyzing) [Bacteroidia bacterium]|jgi:asparagine synthase (glutamine-hydrolysing)|nr:asparagine synthase (glutamine-hydrolyzing) [Bacteroidia bacterium]